MIINKDLYKLLDIRDYNLLNAQHELQKNELVKQKLFEELAIRQNSLEEKEVAIHEKEQEILRLSAGSQNLINSLQYKEQAIQEKENAIHEKEHEISQLSASLQNLVESLKSKDQAIQEKETAIHEKEQEILRLSASAQNLIASLQSKDQAIQGKETVIHEKEQEILRLSASSQTLIASLQSKEQAIQEKETAIHEKEQEILRLSVNAQNQHTSLQSKEQALKEKETSIHEKEKEIIQLNLANYGLIDSIQIKDTIIHDNTHIIDELGREISQLRLKNSELYKELEEKEFCIQAQDKFIKQDDFFKFFFLKACVFAVGYLKLNYKKSIVYKLIKLLRLRTNSILSNLIFKQKKKIKNKFGPFLGILDQYPPKKMVLPKNFYNNIKVNNPLKISIVTPSYRQGEFIERTLNSVLDQKYPNLEYYVQDGGSKDETIAILEKYSQQLDGWESKPDKGQSHAINLGFAKTSGEIMAWLNSDDLLLPGTLAYVSNYFDKHPDVDVVYGNRIIINENDMEIGRWVMPRNDYAVLSWADYVPQETLFWRRSIWEKVGGKIDESFQFAMDWDLLVRFRDSGACINRLPRFMGAFRVHTSQKTSAVIEEIGNKEMMTIRARYNNNCEPSFEDIHKKLENYIRWHFVEQNVHLIHLKR